MFWILAAVLGIAALAFVLRPLLKPPLLDANAERHRALQDAHASGVLDSAELASRLDALGPAPAAPKRASSVLMLTLAVLVPGLSVGLYLAVGAPDALDPAARVATEATAPATMEEAIAALEARLAAQPNDVEGWVLLGRSQRAQENFSAAEAALSRAHALADDDVEILIDYAEAKALATPTRRFEGEALALLQRAEAFAPTNARARWLLGIADMQAGRAGDAARRWESLLSEMPAEAPARAALTRQINDARMQSGQTPLPLESAPVAVAAAPVAPSAPAVAERAAGARIEVEVSLDPAFAGQVPADAVLFVFARAAQGSRVPLAIQRLSAATLPTTVVLDDSMGMIAGMNLSSQSNVIIGARISASGDATPQSGDIEGSTAPLSVTTERTQVRLGQLLP